MLGVSIFDGTTVDLGISLADIFGGIGLFIAQFWPLIALGIAIPLAFGLGRRLMHLGKKSA